MPEDEEDEDRWPYTRPTVRAGLMVYVVIAVTIMLAGFVLFKAGWV